MLTSLFEITFSDAHSVDLDAGVLRGVKILGRESRNGREYSQRALGDAARLYEGIGVNLNHPDRRATHLERPVEAGFGWLEAVEVKADGVYADLHYLTVYPQTGLVQAFEIDPTDNFTNDPTNNYLTVASPPSGGPDGLADNIFNFAQQARSAGR